MAGFGDQIAALNAKYKKRMRAVARESVQDVVEIAQKPQAKGGRMPVITRFLAGSGQGSIGQMPSGPTTNESGATLPPGTQVAGEPISVTLLKWDGQDTLYYGWTAVYARPMEFKYGFMRGATEQWDTIVAAAAARVSI